MRSQDDRSSPVRRLACAVLIVAVASFGALIVRNVTEMLVKIAHQPSSIVIADQPYR